MDYRATYDALQRNPDHLDQLIDEREAAQFLGVSVRAVQNWRSRGGGPSFVRISSRLVRYTRRDLIEWISQHRRRNTSEAA